MSDGRLFTDWNPHSVQDAFVMEKVGIKSSNEYRKYLQANGEDIIRSTNYFFMQTSQCRCDGLSCTLKG